MKGFIEINAQDKAALINVNQIESVWQAQNNVKIYMVGDSQNPCIANNSYEEILIKIKRAMEE